MDRNLTTVERPAVEADPSLAEQHGPAVAEPDRQRRSPGTPGSGRPDPATEATRSSGSLDGKGDRAIRARDEREDRRPVELLHPSDRDRVVEDVHRDPDDLALLLAQVRDRVDQVPLRERQADRDLVDDP